MGVSVIVVAATVLIPLLCEGHLSFVGVEEEGMADNEFVAMAHRPHYYHFLD